MKNKCLTCGENIPVNHCCMSVNLDGKIKSTHMGECELTALQFAVIDILIEWDGLWKKYKKLIPQIKEKHSIIATQKEVKEALQFWVKTGEVGYGPLVDSDYIPCGAGYYWNDGGGIL